MVFGDCCSDLRDAMNAEFTSHFAVAENNVLYLAVGHVVTEDGPGWLEQAVLFCPFCGTEIQTSQDIARKAAN